MTVTLEAPADAVPLFHEFGVDDLAGESPVIDWLLEGYVAPGAVTLLTGGWKAAGKTTLVAALIKRLQAGGQLAGLQVRTGKVLVVSEEEKRHWRLRLAKHQFGDNVRWICRPFRGRKATFADWDNLIEHLLRSCRGQGIQLVVIDSLGKFLPDENNANLVYDALARLERLTEAGIAVLLLHHPRKAASGEGFWSRGNGALCAAVDVLVEMHTISRASATDRRRKLLAFSWYDTTPRRLVIELDEAGTDYRALADVVDGDTNDDLAEWWPTLQMVLSWGRLRETRDALLARWPEEEEKPSPVTLYRWLERAVARGLVVRDGTGIRDKPFRYWLKGQEALWKDDPLCFARRQELHDQGQPEEQAWEEMRQEAGDTEGEPSRVSGRLPPASWDKGQEAWDSLTDADPEAPAPPGSQEAGDRSQEAEGGSQESGAAGPEPDH
jgi:hypothetical protein